MTFKLQVIIGIFCIIGLMYVIHLIRKRKLELKYALSWLFAGVFVLVLDCFPFIMEKLAGLLGIETPANMMFIFAFIFSLIITLVLTLITSIAASSVKRLAQKAALLDKEIIELKKTVNELKNSLER